MYGGFRCVVSCPIQNSSGATQVVDFLNVSNTNTFSITDVMIDLLPPVFPLVINDGDSIALSFTLIAGAIGDLDTVKIDINSTFGFEFQKFDFEAIDMSSSINVSYINFGEVSIGTSVSVPVTITNPTICCYIYSFYSDCAEVNTTSTETNELCKSDEQTIGVVYTPTTTGDITCSVILANESDAIYIPITGRGISPSQQNTRIEQKNKVDQTTSVTNCSPKTANNRCQTARTMQSAIRTNARRFGKR